MNQRDPLAYANALFETTGRAYVDKYRIKNAMQPTEVRASVDAALCETMPEGARFNEISANHGLFIHASIADDERLYVEYWGSGGIAVTRVANTTHELCALLFIRKLSAKLNQTLIVDTPFERDEKIGAENECT